MARRTQQQELVSLFAADGMTLDPALIPTDTAVSTYALIRDETAERKAATFLLGDNLERTTQGGGIYTYTSQQGAAAFRDTGSFDAAGSLSQENAEAFCRDFCKAFSYDTPIFTLDETGSGTATAVRLWSGTPVFNAAVTFTIDQGRVLSASGALLPETGAEYKIRFMLRKDQCEIMLDTTGDGLHKRGYRRNAMEAPIRETLAATIADLGRVRRDSLVEDPFCGSGTLLIEAAQKAMNIAPGLKRRFAAERYGFVPAAIWAEQRQKALAEAKLDVGFEAFGYDIDPAAVALANANAKLAGVEKRCHFEVADVADFAAKQEAIVLTNPPYGERMSTIEGAAKLARTLGRQMEAHPCAGVYAITADMDFETHYGKRANKRRKMYNGMIPCQLYMYYSAPKFEHTAKPMPKSGFDGKRTAPNRFNKK